jgi:hypothetical protein
LAFSKPKLPRLECGQDSKQDFSNHFKMEGIDARKVPKEIQL